MGLDWLALLPPPLIWVSAWGSPFVKIHRPLFAGALSLLSGGLMFASLRASDVMFPTFFGAAGIALLAMFVVMFWPAGESDTEGKPR